MELVTLSHISKSYVSKNVRKDVLKDINLSFSDVGMVFILGKSGCGKSTLLNIIGGIDKPSVGLSFLSIHNHALPINKDRLNFVSYIFQHYHLLEEETSLFNVMLPCLINGASKEEAKTKSYAILKSFGLDHEKINKKTMLLSGGEKERVAIARALIKKPLAILADEPTGALDKKNSINTMEVLKKESKSRLVICVSHNKKLAKKYADRIIILSDGKVKDDVVLNKVENVSKNNERKRKSNDYWQSQLIEHNFKRRLKRNIVSVISMTFSLIFTLLLIGFSLNYDKAIDEVSKKHLDYGASTITKEEKKELEKSSISLVKTSRPSTKEITKIINDFPEFSYEPNYDYLLSNYSILLNNTQIDNISTSFVYDFNPLYINKSYLIKGQIPKENSYGVLINKSFYNDLNKQNINPIGLKIDFKTYYEHVFKNDVSQNSIDKLDLFLSFRILGVVDELDFLASNKIYFSYKTFDDILSETLMEEYSSFKGEEYSWKRLVVESNGNSKESSYSYRLFLKDLKYIDSIEQLNNFLDGEVKLSNSSLEIKEAMDSFVFAADLGLKIFLIIVVIGSVLIISIFSYTSFCDDKKSSAILYCLGARYSKIEGIFITESILIGIIAYIFSFGISYLLQTPINSLIFSFSSIENIVKIPFEQFLGKPYLFPIFMFVCVCVVAVLSSAIPIFVSKKISVKDELADV